MKYLSTYQARPSLAQIFEYLSNQTFLGTNICQSGASQTYKHTYIWSDTYHDRIISCVWPVRAGVKASNDHHWTSIAIKNYINLAILMVHDKKSYILLPPVILLLCSWSSSYAGERSHKTNTVFICLEPSETVTTKIIWKL